MSVEEVMNLIDSYSGPLICQTINNLYRANEKIKSLSFPNFEEVYFYVMNRKKSLPEDFVNEVEFQYRMRKSQKA